MGKLWHKLRWMQTTYQLTEMYTKWKQLNCFLIFFIQVFEVESSAKRERWINWSLMINETSFYRGISQTVMSYLDM